MAVTGIVGLDGKIYPVSDVQVSTMPTHRETQRSISVSCHSAMWSHNAVALDDPPPLNPLPVVCLLPAGEAQGGFPGPLDPGAAGAEGQRPQHGAAGELEGGHHDGGEDGGLSSRRRPIAHPPRRQHGGADRPGRRRQARCVTPCACTIHVAPERRTHDLTSIRLCLCLLCPGLQGRSSTRRAPTSRSPSPSTCRASPAPSGQARCSCTRPRPLGCRI